MSPAKNIASAPRNIRTATQALLPMGAFGRTGGTGGWPPPSDGFFVSLGGSGAPSRRAVDLRAIDLSINNDKGDHRRYIEDNQHRQNQTHAPISAPHAAELIHEKLTHNGTRSNAITTKSTGK